MIIIVVFLISMLLKLFSPFMVRGIYFNRNTTIFVCINLFSVMNPFNIALIFLIFINKTKTTELMNDSLALDDIFKQN